MTAVADIQAALYREALGYDTNDMELLAGAFTADVTMTGMNEPVVGRDAMVARMSGMRDQVPADSRPRHAVTNVLIESESATEARSRAYFTFSIATVGSVTVLATGCYHDRWVNDGAGWRIAERTVESDASP